MAEDGGNLPTWRRNGTAFIDAVHHEIIAIMFHDYFLFRSPRLYRCRCIRRPKYQAGVLKWKHTINTLAISFLISFPRYHSVVDSIVWI